MIGQNVCYIRVSSVDQNEGRQLEGLQQAGITIDKNFIDKVSGKSLKRPALEDCLSYVREGDTLFVYSIDRLARNLYDLQKLVTFLTKKGVIIHFVKENMKFEPSSATNPIQTFMLQMLGAFAEFERSIIKERQREGIELAKKQGRKIGRGIGVTPAQVEEIKKRVKDGESISSIAKLMGFSRPTIYRYLQ